MTLNVYVGWDEKDALAYEVCAQSLQAHASIPVNVIPLKHWELRAKKLFWREHHVIGDGQMLDLRDGKPCSTTFSFTRFLVPELEEFQPGRALFIDPDMLWRCDVADVIRSCKGDKAVWCVQHDHSPRESHKFNTNVVQTLYRRKNWSSLMVFNPAKCRHLTKFRVNQDSGSHLHGMLWVHEDEIGAIPEEYNWLEGHSPMTLDPKVVHFTRGTPDMLSGLPYEEEWRAYV